VKNHPQRFSCRVFKINKIFEKVMKMDLTQKTIEELFFSQMKALSIKACRDLKRFDMQFAGALK